MQLIRQTRIEGGFEGLAQGKIFTLTNGEQFRQKSSKYKYHYGYRPHVKVFKDGSRWYLDIIGMNDVIEVVKIH